jgi:hypothetical protein
VYRVATVPICHITFKLKFFQNYWVSRLRPSSGILNTRKHNVTDLFPKRCVFLYLKFRTMDKVQKSSNSERYTPSSESFRLYFKFFHLLTGQVPNSTEQNHVLEPNSRSAGEKNFPPFLERSPLSLVSTIEELLERASSGSGLENREYGRTDPSR